MYICSIKNQLNIYQLPSFPDLTSNKLPTYHQHKRRHTWNTNIKPDGVVYTRVRNRCIYHRGNVQNKYNFQGSSKIIQDVQLPKRKQI